MRHRAVAALLSSCASPSDLPLGAALHAAILKGAPNDDRGVDLIVRNSLIAMYSNCGALSDALRVFDETPHRDSVTWNTLISALLRRGLLSDGFRAFSRMRRAGDSPFDRFTLTALLSADPRTTHALAVSTGLSRETSVGNALVTGYFRSGSPRDAATAFGEIPRRTVVSWTAAVWGLARSRRTWRESLLVFRDMRRRARANSLTYSAALAACAGGGALPEARQIHALLVRSGAERDLRARTVLVDAYSRCGAARDARRAFESAGDPDAVARTVFLSGLARGGRGGEAFGVFAAVVREGAEIDEDMVSAVLGAYGSSAPAPYALGRQIHAMATKSGFASNTFVSNGLVAMYSRCGDLEGAVGVFRGMAARTAASWNAAIAAYARHGMAGEALGVYEEMRREGFGGTDVTYLSLLHACSHAGAVEEGARVLRWMAGVGARSVHRACAVDMLGRAGRLEEARDLAESCAEEEGDGGLVWRALRGACGIAGDAEMRGRARERLRLVPAAESPRKERAGVRGRAGKEMGRSWIEVSGIVLDQ